MQALQFAVDQAPFACGAASAHPTTTATATATATTGTVVCQEGAEAGTVASRDPDSSGVRFAVRAGLQFACNYCVGSEENKALLWDAWFPRCLMVRARVRPLASLAARGC